MDDPFFFHVDSQERKPQVQRDWLEVFRRRAHHIHEADVCALSLRRSCGLAGCRAFRSLTLRELIKQQIFRNQCTKKTDNVR